MLVVRAVFIRMLSLYLAHEAFIRILTLALALTRAQTSWSGPDSRSWRTRSRTLRRLCRPGQSGQIRSGSDKVAGPKGLNKDPEPSSALPAPGGAANLALALSIAMALTAAARQAKQQTNPSCLASTAVTATTSPTADAVPITAEACKRDGAARGAATRGNAGASRLASQGRGDQQGQDDEHAGKAVGTQGVFVSDGGGRRGPSAGDNRAAAGNTLRPSGRA